MASYYKHLYAPDHLLLAWRRLSKKKHSRGFDGQTIERFRQELDRNIKAISSDLRLRRFQFTPFLGVLRDKAGGGRRPIKIPAVRDRVVLKAIQLLIAPRFDKYNLPCSFGYVPGVRVADAVNRVRKLAARGNVWVLEGDISKFFDSVDRPLLMDRFVRKIRIPSLEDLVFQALQVEVGNLNEFRPDDRDMFPLGDSGIPQGGVLSPMLANLYLYQFDKAMTDAGYDLVRYADDFVVMCPSQERARAAYSLAKRVLEEQLRLTLHPMGEGSKTRITLYSKGFIFLGLHFQGGRVTPSSKAAGRFRQKISALTDPQQGWSLLKTLSSLSRAIDGWGHAYLAYDSREAFCELDRQVREALSRYLRAYGLIQQGHLISSRQRRFLGIPSLEGIRQRVPSR